MALKMCCLPPLFFALFSLGLRVEKFQRTDEFQILSAIERASASSLTVLVVSLVTVAAASVYLRFSGDARSYLVRGQTWALVALADGRELERALISGLSLRKKEGPTGALVLEWVLSNGTTLPIHQHLNGTFPRSARRFGQAFATAVQLPFSCYVPTDGLHQPRSKVVALAFVASFPLYGFALFAAPFVAVWAKNPFARFYARLALFVYGIQLILLTAGLLLIFPIIMLDIEPWKSMWISYTRYGCIAAFVVIMVLALVSISGLLNASLHARKGQVWVSPWLRRFVQRWDSYRLAVEQSETWNRNQK